MSGNTDIETSVSVRNPVELPYIHVTNFDGHSVIPYMSPSTLFMHTKQQTFETLPIPPIESLVNYAVGEGIRHVPELRRKILQKELPHYDVEASSSMSSEEVILKLVRNVDTALAPSNATTILRRAAMTNIVCEDDLGSIGMAVLLDCGIANDYEKVTNVVDANEKSRKRLDAKLKAADCNSQQARG